MKQDVWATADRVSDRITDVLSSELDEMRRTDTVEALLLLAGLLLALLNFLNTAPRATASMVVLHKVANVCLAEIESRKKGK